MCWSTEGANAIIVFPSCILAGRYEDSWEERATRNCEISQSSRTLSAVARYDRLAFPERSRILGKGDITV